MKARTPKWLRWQRGQALAEYWPTIPAAITLLLVGGLVVQFITGSLLTTVDYLNPVGFECEEKPPAYVSEGPETATPMGNHEIQLLSKTYDPETDRTTVVYRVTNVPSPDISHWVLGMPPGVRKHILSTSEPYEIVDGDPHNSIVGIKFDKEYGSPGGGKKSSLGYALVGYSPRAEVTSRDVIITLAGYYDWGVVEVGLKAGTQVYHNTITGPVQMIDPPEGAC